MVCVDCMEMDMRNFVVFRPVSAAPPMRIENFSSYEIEFCQEGQEEIYVVDAGFEMDYIFDSVTEKADYPKLQFMVHGKEKQTTLVSPYDDEPSKLRFTNLGGEAAQLVVTVVPNDAESCFSYIVTDSVADVRQLFGLSADTESEEAVDEDMVLDVSLQLDGIGLSLVASDDVEDIRDFAYFLVDKVSASYSETSDYRKMALNVNRLQLDYQSPEAMYPVPIYAAQEDVHADDDAYADVFVASYIVRLGHIGIGRALDSVEYLSARVLPLNVLIDGPFVVDGMSFGKIASIMPENDDAVPEPESETAQYWQDVELHPLSASITITNIDAVLDFLPAAVRSVGVSFFNLSNVNFKISSVSLERLFMTSTQLSDRIGSVYYENVMRFLIQQGAFRGIGGLQIFGDPLGSFQSVAGGVTSLFYEPYKAAVKSPADFGKGVGKGAKKFTGGVIGGAFGAGAKATGAAGSGLATATLDAKFQEQRRHDLRQRPDNAGAGLMRGAQRFGKGLFAGITGIVTTPIQEGREKGFVGGLAGVGKGLVGVITKPASGAVDLVSQTLQGIEANVTNKKGVRRSRQPRVFGHDGLVLPYSPFSADGLRMLLEVDSIFKQYGEHRYIAHFTEHLGKDKSTDVHRITMVLDKVVIVVMRTKGFKVVKVCIAMVFVSLFCV